MNPTNNMQRDYWLECSIDGNYYPRKQMRRQRGWWVCLECYDEPGAQYYRDQLDMDRFVEESVPITIPDDVFPDPSE